MKSEKFEPLISPLDPRRLIPLAEVAKRTGFGIRTLQRYASDGVIPGAKRAGPRKAWKFERKAIEAWWQRFNEEGRAA